MLEGPHVVGIEAVRLTIAGLARRELLQEALRLNIRIVQLPRSVRHLHAADVELEALGEAGSVGFCFASGEISTGWSMMKVPAAPGARTELLEERREQQA